MLHTGNVVIGAIKDKSTPSWLLVGYVCYAAYSIMLIPTISKKYLAAGIHTVCMSTLLQVGPKISQFAKDEPEYVASTAPLS